MCVCYHLPNVILVILCSQLRLLLSKTLGGYRWKDILRGNLDFCLFLKKVRLSFLIYWGKGPFHRDTSSVYICDIFPHLQHDNFIFYLLKLLQFKTIYHYNVSSNFFISLAFNPCLAFFSSVSNISSVLDVPMFLHCVIWIKYFFYNQKHVCENEAELMQKV